MSEIYAQPTATRPWTLVGLLGLAIVGFALNEAFHDARHVAGFPCH